MIARSVKVIIRDACSVYILKTKAQRDGYDISLPIPVIYERVRALLKEVFCFERPEFGKTDIWDGISFQTKKKFNFNLDSEDLYNIHLPRLFQALIE